MRGGPRLRGRLAVVAVFAPVLTVAGLMFALTSDCHTDLQCTVSGGVFYAMLFGGWALLAVAVLGSSYLRARGSSRTAWPANGAIVGCCLLLFAAAPLYSTFRSGLAGATQGGRERIHRDATKEVVAFVDGTLRAIAPGATPTVTVTPGSRTGNDTGTCERTHYSVTFAVPKERTEEMIRAAVAHWTSLGLDPHTSPQLRGFVNVTSGEMLYALSARSDRPAMELGGTGPCLDV